MGPLPFYSERGEGCATAGLAGAAWSLPSEFGDDLGCRTVFLQGRAHLDFGELLDWQAWLGAIRMALEEEEAVCLRLFLPLSALDLLPLAMVHLVWNSQACTEKWPQSPRCTSCPAR